LQTSKLSTTFRNAVIISINRKFDDIWFYGKMHQGSISIKFPSELLSITTFVQLDVNLLPGTEYTKGFSALCSLID
jgi:hypothetical protein